MEPQHAEMPSIRECDNNSLNVIINVITDECSNKNITVVINMVITFHEEKEGK